MARILPTPLPERINTDPGRSAERKVYHAFSEQIPDGVTIFYSVSWLGRPEKGPPMDGEADFVVAHPQHGLIVLEVKGGRITYDGNRDRWFSKDRHGKLHPIGDPFEQARRTKYALIKKIKQHPAWKGQWVDVGHGVIFPDSARPDRPMGIDAPDQIMAFAEDIKRLDKWMDRVFHFWVEQDDVEGVFGSRGMQMVEKLFAPSFDLRHPLAADLAEDERQILHLTEEQFAILDLLSRRRRVGIKGGAGTGKTMLALEKARRLASEGFRTLLTCYNRPLAEDLASRAREVDSLTVMNFHQLCYSMAQKADCPVVDPEGETPPPEYFEKELPAALLRALECLREERFDAIVVDEGQDFAEDWWTALQFALSDPDYGILYVFFDDNQRIYRHVDSLPQDLDVYPLTKNLRNTVPIHHLACAFYEGGELRAGGPKGRPPEFIEAVNEHAVAKETSRVLHRLIHEEHLAPGDVAVLTGKSRDSSGLPKEGMIGAFGVTDGSDPDPKKVVFDSIRRFKGLERPVVVLVELEEVIDSPETLYVGLTRANAHLVVIGTSRVLEILRDAPVKEECRV
jgi:hypothetical protein